MPYFVRIGAHQRTLSGVASRGYHVYRRGATVTTVWGSVAVRPNREFYWCHTTQYKVFRYRSESAARAKVEEVINERMNRERYSRLPVGVRIRRGKSVSGGKVRRS